MHLRYFEPRKGRIEIIPMIDVMFFLLVFFIVITLQMLPDQGLNLLLPQSTETEELPPPQVTVNIATDGSASVKGESLTMPQLVTMLEGGDVTHTQVTIAASKDVPFQKFMNVMDAVRQAGVSDIGIAAEPIS